MRTPVNAQELFPYFLALVALALLVVAIIYIVRKMRRKENRAAVYVPVRTCRSYRIATAWNSSGWKNPGFKKPVKTYYINLTDILRHYMERRYHIMALEADNG